MIDQECQDRSGYRYAEFLLQDKRRELQILKLRHSRMVISSEDYHSCRRSLLDAISQLEALLRGDIEREPAQGCEHTSENDFYDTNQN
jgi:hypothetical protein